MPVLAIARCRFLPACTAAAMWAPWSVCVIECRLRERGAMGWRCCFRLLRGQAPKSGPQALPHMSSTPYYSAIVPQASSAIQAHAPLMIDLLAYIEQHIGEAKPGNRVIAARVRVVARIAVPLVSVARRRDQLHPRTAGKHRSPLSAGLPRLQPDLVAVRNGLCIRAAASTGISATLRHAADAVAPPVPRRAAHTDVRTWPLHADVALHARTEPEHATRRSPGARRDVAAAQRFARAYRSAASSRPAAACTCD